MKLKILGMAVLLLSSMKEYLFLELSSCNIKEGRKEGEKEGRERREGERKGRKKRKEQNEWLEQ